jgi:hypothetical protein
MTTNTDEYYHMDVGSNMSICGEFIDPVKNRERGDEAVEFCPECARVSGGAPRKHPPGHPRAGQYVRHDD